MNHQGAPFGITKVSRIRHLLQTTELGMAAIASRLDCSRGKVSAVNKQYAIRNYQGNHSTFELIPGKTK